MRLVYHCWVVWCKLQVVPSSPRSLLVEMMERFCLSSTGLLVMTSSDLNLYNQIGLHNLIV